MDENPRASRGDEPGDRPSGDAEAGRFVSEEQAIRDAAGVGHALIASVSAVVAGNADVIYNAVAVLLSGQHVLVEGRPGAGKTLLARTLASSIAGARYARVQGMPDLLGTDLTGAPIYSLHTEEHRFHEGPIFSNVLMVDELNRMPPRTQAALLEAMEEGQVTPVDGVARELPDPFFVVATQNPLGQVGTFPLVEGQLDRFALRLPIADADLSLTRSVLDLEFGAEPTPLSNGPEVSTKALSMARAAVRRVAVAPPVLDYIARLSDHLSRDHRVLAGPSLRAAVSVARTAQARAVLVGRGYVTVDDIQALLAPAWIHRIELATGVGDEVMKVFQSLVHGALTSVTVPRHGG